MDEIRKLVGNTIKAVGELADELFTLEGIEQLQIYATIRVLCNELLEYARKGYAPELLAEEKVYEFIDDCRQVVGLYPSDHSIDCLRSFVLGGITRLKTIYHWD